MANTAIEIHRPDRSHVEISDPAQIPEFLDSAYGYPTNRLAEMTALLGAIDTVIAEAKAARKRAVNDPEEFNVTSIIDDAVALLEQVKTRLQQNISAGGDDFCKQPAGYIE